MAQNLVPRRCGKINTTPIARGTPGEMADLMDSIKRVGLIHPPVIDSKNNIVAGRRRLEACKRLGYEFVSVIQCDTYDDQLKALEAERDENQCRVKYTPSEIKEHADAMRAILEPEAAKRQAHGKTGQGFSRFPQVGESVDSPVHVSATIAAAVGVSEEQLRKIETVHEAAEADPKALGHLPEQMDTTGKVDPAYKEVVAKTPKKKQKKATTKGEELKDEIGQKVPDELRDIFGDLFLEDAAAALGEMMAGLKNICKATRTKGEAFAKYLLAGEILKSLESASTEIDSARAHFAECKPFAVHHACTGKGCKVCRMEGWLPKHRYTEVKKDGDF